MDLDCAHSEWRGQNLKDHSLLGACVYKIHENFETRGWGCWLCVYAPSFHVCTSKDTECPIFFLHDHYCLFVMEYLMLERLLLFASYVIFSALYVLSFFKLLDFLYRIYFVKGSHLLVISIFNLYLDV